MLYSSSPRVRSRRLRALLLAALPALPAAGQVSTWDPTVVDGVLSKPANWVGGQVPGAGSEIRLNTAGANDAASTFDVGTSPSYGALYLQYPGTAAARFTLRVDDPLAKLLAQSIYVGYDGAARIVQTQGSVSTGGAVSLADGQDGAGGYELAGGVLRMSRLYVGYRGTGTFAQSGGQLSISGRDGMDLGEFAGSSGTFTLTGGDPTTVVTLRVGVAGTGSFVQRAGSVTVTPVSWPQPAFVVGSAAGGAGTYELYAGASLSTYGDATVGGDGTGTFTQYGGSNATSGQRGLILGEGASGRGTYSLLGGTLTSSLTLGLAGGAQGAFRQSAGAVSAIESNVGVAGAGSMELSGGTYTTTHLNLGTAAGGSGSVTLSAGTLTVQGLQTVGGAGTGSFTQTGGTNGAKDLWIRSPGGAESTYTLAGGQLNVASRESVADTGVARFVQTGGTNSAVDFRVADGANSDGEYQLRGGDLNIAQLTVGGAGNGRFVYSGGRLTFTGTSSLKIGVFGGSGTFTMTNAASDATIPWISVANGTVEQATGAITLTSTTFPALDLGRGNPGAGTYNLRDGATLTASGGNEWVGNSGQGTFNQYGGANTVSGAGRLFISGNTGSGTYNLYGGTLRANINLGSPGGVLRQTGGSLISGTVSANYGSVVGVEGGDFETTDLVVGRVGGGAFNVSGGTARVLGTLSVDGHSTSRLLETGGSLVVGKLTVGSAMTAGSVTLQGGSLEAASIEVYNGSFTQTAGTLKAASLLVSGGAVMLGGTQNWANASTLTATRGTLTLASDAGSATAANLGVDVAGATTTLRGVQHFRALHVGSGSVASGDLLVTRNLKVDGTGRLDLARGALVVDYAAGAMSPLGDVTASILAARGTGSWDGPGITSSAAAGMADVAVGYAEAADVLGASGGMFLGEAVDPTAVLVRVTRAGDANLNGTVEFGDLLSLARHYNTDVSAAPGGGWVAGDFTYDGLINFTDLLVLARNYNSTAPLGEVPGASASLKADLAAAFAQVPEPATGALVGAGIFWRCMRRARRRR